VPSLPVRVIRELGYREPAARRVLLNWRGKPFSYQTVTFSSVFNDMLSKNRTRPQDEFTNKIVLIGSTAPSLFDVKPTPMSRLHPGVEILATAIDNMKRGDYLRYPEGRILYPLLTLLIVWATAWAFYHNVGRAKIDPLFGASQFILLVVSYASINFTNTYINLTGPVTVGLVYFTARLPQLPARSETSALRASWNGTGACRLSISMWRTDARWKVAETSAETEKWVRAKSVEMLGGSQKVFGLSLSTPCQCLDGPHKIKRPVTV
jgi:hypothetical protein